MSYNNKLLVCSDCGSQDVDVKVWANVNEVCKGIPLEEYQDTEENAYCNSCNTEQRSLNKAEFSVEKKEEKWKIIKYPGTQKWK